MEECQTLTFVVDKRASKPQIKKAFKEAYDVDVSAVRTLIRYDMSVFFCPILISMIDWIVHSCRRFFVGAGILRIYVYLEYVYVSHSPDGQKKAYIRLAPGAEAVQVASKMGVF